MRSRVFVFTVALLLGMSRAAHATSFCFNPGTEALVSLAAAQNFKTPKKGTCSPVNGFDLLAGGSGRPRLVSGTACLNSAGDTLYVDYTVHYAAVSSGDSAAPLQVSMSLPFPSLEGGFGFVAINLLSGTTNQENSTTGAHANKCIPQKLEIP